MEVFNDRLRQLREERDIKQINAADDLRIPRGTYASYERGTVPPPAVLCQLADYYGVSVDWLIGRSSERNPAAASAISGAVNALADLTAAAPDAETVLAFFEAAAEYCRAGSPCGSAPLESARDYLAGLTDALRAASRGDLPGVLAGTDQAIGASLRIHQMPGELLKRGE